MKPKPVDKIDRILAEKGNVGREHWQDLFAASLPPPPHPERFVKASFRMTHDMSRYASICAANDGISREEWMRRLMAVRIEQVLGVPASSLMVYREGRSELPQHTRERLKDV